MLWFIRFRWINEPIVKTNADDELVLRKQELDFLSFETQDSDDKYILETQDSYAKYILEMEQDRIFEDYLEREYDRIFEDYLERENEKQDYYYERSLQMEIDQKAYIYGVWWRLGM